MWFLWAPWCSPTPFLDPTKSFRKWVEPGETFAKQGFFLATGDFIGSSFFRRWIYSRCYHSTITVRHAKLWQPFYDWFYILWQQFCCCTHHTVSEFQRCPWAQKSWGRQPTVYFICHKTTSHISSSNPLQFYGRTVLTKSFYVSKQLSKAHCFWLLNSYQLSASLLMLP